MDSNREKKGRFADAVDGSLIVGGFRTASGWIYKKIRWGLIGSIFTSFTKVDACFRRSLMGFGTRRVRGRDTLYKKIRRTAADKFEKSLFLGLVNRTVEYLLTSSLRLYGAFGIIFGIYTMLMFTVKVYALKIDTNINDFIVGALLFMLSLPMLYVRRPLISLIHESRIFRSVFYSTLRIHEAKFLKPQQKNSAKYNAAIIAGMIFGFVTYFVSPVNILLAFAVLIVTAVIFYQPEAGIIGLIIAVPFLSVVSHPTLILSVGVILTSVSCLIKYVRGKRMLKSGPIGVFVTLFAMAMLFGGIVGTGGIESFQTAAIYAVLMLGYFLVVNLLRTRESCRHAFVALGLSMVVAAVYGIFQYFFGGLTANWLDTEMFSYIPGRATSFFDNPNMLGSYLIMITPVLFVLALYTKGFKKRFLLVMSILASVACLAFTWSRGAWLGFICGTIVFFLIYSHKTIAFLLAGALSLPFIGMLLPSGLTDRFLSIGNMADSSTYYRVYTWKGVLRMLSEVWYSGVGVGQAAFEQVYPIFAFAGTEASPHAHNLLIQLVVEIGVCGVVMFLVVLFLFTQNCFEFIADSKGEDRGIAAAGLSGIASAMVMGLFDHIWYNFRVFFVYWIVMALTNAYIASARSERAGSYDKMQPDIADVTLYNL